MSATAVYVPRQSVPDPEAIDEAVNLRGVDLADWIYAGVVLVGALGIGGVVLAPALHGVLENVIAGVVIHTRCPFEFGGSSINITVMARHSPTEASMWVVRNAMVEAILAAFAVEGIEIPFPRRVLEWLPDGSGTDDAPRPQRDRDGTDQA